MSTPWKALVEYKRAGLTETRKFGAVSWVSGRKPFYQCGAGDLFFGRSTAKPLHIKVFVKELADILTWEEKALSVASHNAEPMHIEALNKILDKKEQEWIRVPPSMPFFGAPSSAHKDPERAFHPCSGEHSAIIRGCMEKHWSLADYTSIQHPFHHAFLSYIQSVLGSSWRPEYLAKDGCGLATVSFTLDELATLFANLEQEKNKDWIWEAMVRNPQIVGGTNRLDTTIMQSCGGNVIAKEGADGILGLSITHPEHPEGLGIIIKLAYGSDAQAMGYIARGILGTLGWEIPLTGKLFRQEAVLDPELVPEFLRAKLVKIPTRNVSENLDDTF